MCYGMTEQEWEQYKAYMEDREARPDDKEVEPGSDDVEADTSVPVAFREQDESWVVRESEEVSLT